MSKSMDEHERQEQLFCTPPHITKALLKREVFPGTIWEPATGKGHIVRVLLDCGHRDVLASDITDWGFEPCRIEDFLVTTNEVDCILANPPFDLKAKFLAQAKRLARLKIALLLPVGWKHTMEFVCQHLADSEFPWKALYSFPQGIQWANVQRRWGCSSTHGSCSSGGIAVTWCERRSFFVETDRCPQGPSVMWPERTSSDHKDLMSCVSGEQEAAPQRPDVRLDRGGAVYPRETRRAIALFITRT